MDNPLLGPGLDRLRTRRSVKWRLYGPDVLPAWVAEMDVVPAEPIRRAVRDAVEAGDTGYPWAQDYRGRAGNAGRDVDDGRCVLADRHGSESSFGSRRLRLSRAHNGSG